MVSSSELSVFSDDALSERGVGTIQVEIPMRGSTNRWATNHSAMTPSNMRNVSTMRFSDFHWYH
jgi:hypothetical protein